MRRLADELKAALGDAPLDGVTLSGIQRAAELGVIASDLRARRLRGESIEVDAIVKAENAHRRAVADLGIAKRRDELPGPSLEDYLRSAEVEEGDDGASA